MHRVFLVNYSIEISYVYIFRNWVGRMQCKFKAILKGAIILSLPRRCMFQGYGGGEM